MSLAKAMPWMCLLLAGCSFAGESRQISPGDDIETAVRGLEPGDELVLAGGTYLFDENVTLTANGTSEEPIVIRPLGTEQPILTQATRRQNVVEITDSSNLIIRGLTFTGGSQGIRLRNSDYITIENCEVYETGDVAISANAGGTYEGLRLIGNHIHHTNGTGEGMYLGCNNDKCRVANSLIAGNYIHHTNRSTVEQGDGIELKEGSYGNTIRDNVIHDTKYPAILVYSTVGNGERNIIEGNLVWNVDDNTVQIAADAVFRNNIVLGNVAMQPHQAGSPSNIDVVNNTIVSPGDGIVVRGISGPVSIINNAVYARGWAIRQVGGGIEMLTMSGNVGVGRRSHGDDGFTTGKGLREDFRNASFSGTPPQDLYPAAGSALVGAGVPGVSIPDDFDGEPRKEPIDAGAYKYSKDGEPVWALAEAFKHDGT